MTQYNFATGTLIGKRTDVLLTPPAFFGTLQDVSIDFDQKLESLIGQNKVAVDLGDGEFKITGKAKFARVQMTTWNNLMFNQTPATATGLEMPITGEAHTIPATSGPYTVTVTNSALTPLEDFGVFYQATGIQLTPAASASGAGIYSFVASTGVYTFNAADASLGVYIYYTYTPASGVQDILYVNPLQGTSPTFEIFFENQYGRFGVTKTFSIKLNACKSSKLSLPFSNQKFMIQDFDWQCFADSAGNVMTVTSSE